jgi:hypothetical protein
MRAVVITIENRTSRAFTRPTTYFDSGMMDGTPPFEIPAGRAAVFTVRMKPGFIGVKGVICYRVEGKHDFVVYFENPYTGKNWHGAELYRDVSRSAYDNYKKIPKRRADNAHHTSVRGYSVYSYGSGGNNSKQVSSLTQAGSGRLLVSLSPKQPIADQVGSTKVVKLTSIYNTRLRATPDGSVDLSYTNSEWEQWTAKYLGDNQYTLKSAHGSFLSVDKMGNIGLTPDSSDEAVITVDFVGDRIVARTRYGSYLRAFSNGTIGLTSTLEERDTWSF